MDGGGEARCWLSVFLYYFDGESEGESGEGREAQLIWRGETDAYTCTSPRGYGRLVNSS